MIVGLFTELLAPGGVQIAGRHTATVLSEIARERGGPYRFLSLNDPIGEHENPSRRLDFLSFGDSIEASTRLSLLHWGSPSSNLA